MRVYVCLAAASGVVRRQRRAAAVVGCRDRTLLESTFSAYVCARMGCSESVSICVHSAWLVCVCLCIRVCVCICMCTLERSEKQPLQILPIDSPITALVAQVGSCLTAVQLHCRVMKLV